MRVVNERGGRSSPTPLVSLSPTPGPAPTEQAGEFQVSVLVDENQLHAEPQGICVDEMGNQGTGVADRLAH